MNLDLSKIRERVGIIPWWVRKFPGFTKIGGFPLKNKFLLSPELYNDLMSEKPSPYVIGVVIHELEHLKRAKEKGFLKYHIIYRVNPSFRYNEEIECHKPQVDYYKKVGYSFDLEKRAKILSGSLYFWCVSYNKALKDLTNLWQA